MPSSHQTVPQTQVREKEEEREGRAWGGPHSWLQTTVDTLPDPLSTHFLGAMIEPASGQHPVWGLALGPAAALEGRGGAGGRSPLGLRCDAHFLSSSLRPSPGGQIWGLKYSDDSKIRLAAQTPPPPSSAVHDIPGHPTAHPSTSVTWVPLLPGLVPRSSADLRG